MWTVWCFGAGCRLYTVWCFLHHLSAVPMPSSQRYAEIHAMHKSVVASPCGGRHCCSPTLPFVGKKWEGQMPGTLVGSCPDGNCQCWEVSCAASPVSPCWRLPAAFSSETLLWCMVGDKAKKLTLLLPLRKPPPEPVRRWVLRPQEHGKLLKA